jgi:hypothetical protein
MGMAVVTVAAGGKPVVETPRGTPVTEATNKYGVPVTKVVGKPGLPVVFETLGMPPGFAAFDPATATDTTLSNNNLTATHATGTVNTGVRGAPARSSGKFYFEVTRSAIGSSDGVGLITGVGGTYGNVLAGSNCTSVFTVSGNISSNNAASGKNIGGIGAGVVIGIAVDLDARKAWFRSGAAGNWNGLAIGSENPALGLGGVVIAPTVSFTPVVAWGSGTGGVYIANFGNSVFAGAVPPGFTSGWPA